MSRPAMTLFRDDENRNFFGKAHRAGKTKSIPSNASQKIFSQFLTYIWKN
jgi:hypothetical protein